MCVADARVCRPDSCVLFSTLGIQLEECMRFRNRFDHDRVRQVFTLPTTTKQEFKDECDINILVEKAKRGIAPPLDSRIPQFGDFSNIPTFEQAFDIVAEANEAFMTLPALLRKELGNDPSRIGELTREQAERYKLLKTPPTPPADSQPEPRAGASEPAAGKPSKKAKESSHDDT